MQKWIHTKGILFFVILNLLCGFSYSQTDSIHSNLSFDFGFTRGRNIYLWPVLYRYKSADRKELQIIYPLYSQKTDYKQPSTHFQLLPFFISDSNAQKTDQRFITLYYPSIFRYQRMNTVGHTIKSYNFFELAPTISLLGISRDSAGMYVENNLFFFIWYKRDSLLDKSRFIVFPLYWNYTDKAYTSRLLLPLYYQKTGPDLNHCNVALVFNYKRTAFEKNTLLFPVYRSKLLYGEGDTLLKKTVFPVYWYSRSHEKNNRVFFPLVYSLKNPKYHSLTILPFFTRGCSSDSARQHFSIMPVYWHSKNSYQLTNVVFPLWWSQSYFLWNDTIWHNTLFPIYWSVKSKFKLNTVIFPLVYSLQNNNRKSVTVFPFYSSGHSIRNNQSYFAITPFYWHQQLTDGKRDLLFPVFWSRLQFTPGDTLHKKTVFPLYWSTKGSFINNQVFFPLVFSLKNRDYQSLTILPFFTKGCSADGLRRHFNILPVYWHMKTSNQVTNVVFPLWWGKTNYYEQDTVKQNTLFPIYWSVKSGTKNNKVLFPLVFSLQNKTRKSFTAFPLYSFGHYMDSSRSYWAVTPLYWHRQQKDGTRDMLFPIYWSRLQYINGDTVSKKTVFPLYWSEKSRLKNNQVLFPLVFNLKNPDYKSLTVFPLFSTGCSADSVRRHLTILPVYWHLKNPQNSANIVFPLWWGKTNYALNDTVKQKTLFPIYWSVKGKTKNNTVLFPLYFKVKKDERQSTTIFPFYSHGFSKDQNKSYIAITPLYWHQQQNNSKQYLLFPIYWNRIRYTGTDTINTKTLGWLYWSTKSRTLSNRVLIPIMFWLKDTSYHSFTLLPLLSAGKSVHTRSKHFLLTPFSGYLNFPQNKQLYLFPVFNYKKTADQTRTSFLLFAYRNTKKTGYSKTSVLWPLCERTLYNNYNYFRLAPIIWHLKTDTSNMVFLLPFYYSLKTETKKTVAICWFLYRYQNIRGKSVSNDFLWKFYNHERCSNGDFETRFLYFVYANIHKNGKMEKRVFPFYHKMYQPNGDKYLGVFFSFYNHFKQYKPEMNDFYEEERILWFIRFRSNYSVLKQEGKTPYFKSK